MDCNDCRNAPDSLRIGDKAGHRLIWDCSRPTPDCQSWQFITASERGQGTATLALAVGMVGAGVFALLHFGAQIVAEVEPIIAALG